ncbi:MAG: hypothetical protein ABI434_18905 [Burkholderiaceae bacterium]
MKSSLRHLDLIAQLRQILTLSRNCPVLGWQGTRPAQPLERGPLGVVADANLTIGSENQARSGAGFAVAVADDEVTAWEVAGMMISNLSCRFLTRMRLGSRARHEPAAIAFHSAGIQ